MTADVTRVGRGADNTLVLSDPDLSDYLASIVQRDGRFAIITTVPQGLEIDGIEVPAERWVWLPEQAQIRVSRRTALEFTTANGALADEVPPAAGDASPAASTVPAARKKSGSSSAQLPRPPGTKARRAAAAPSSEGSSGTLGTRHKGEKKTRTVARFITDGPGDPLVKLGDDGHLPVLQLSEAAAASKARGEVRKKESNLAILYVVLAASLGLSFLVLFMEGPQLAGNAASKDTAREQIVDFYGDGAQSPRPYQLHLRQARQAHSRGDVEAERREYRRVLDLLRSEANDTLHRHTGVTGREDADRELERLIGILLSE
ncbi:MAG: hypothetical protein ACT4QC_04470 [Planctomycetaceae bacterium]